MENYRMLCFETILQNSETTLNSAINFARSFDFSEEELIESDRKFCVLRAEINGIEIYYNYAADFYIFAPKNKDNL